MTVVEILLLVGLGLTLILNLAIFIAADTSRRRTRRTFQVLDEVREWALAELERQRLNYSKAQRKIQQLEHESPEKLKWELQRLTEELQQLQQLHSQTLQQSGQQKQEWLHQAEQQEHQRLHLERERQHLMEELERWRSRYIEASQQLERLKQERLKDQQNVEELTQMLPELLAQNYEIPTKAPNPFAQANSSTL